MCERYWGDRWELMDGPVPKRTACSGVSMSVPRLDLHAGRIWNFMRALTPETTACGSMQWTNSRCLCCRRVSLTSKCRSRSWKGPSDAQHATGERGDVLSVAPGVWRAEDRAGKAPEGP